MSSGTWTRTGASVANFGPDTIYSNTAPTGYFFAAGGNGDFAPGSINFDEGNIPGSTNTNYAGGRDEYRVNCVSIGYCDFGTATSGWRISFYSSYDPCTFDASPSETMDFTGAPANGCWIVDIDLTGGAEICLAADGGDGFDDLLDLDSFGWSWRYIGASGFNDQAGFMVAGDPLSTDPNYVAGAPPVDGTSTIFGPASLCSPDSATGLQTTDEWYLEDPVTAANSACYFFGGYTNINSCGGPAVPFASWYLELQADTCGCFCPGGTQSGCSSNPNSTGVNSSMLIAGSASIASDDVTLVALVPTNSLAFFITSQNPGFVATPGGSAGNLCLGAGIGRFQDLAMDSGPAGVVELSTLLGQWSVTSIPGPSGTYAAVAGGRAYFQCWHRDVGPSGPTSNFTDGTVITWQP
jgi:hypothetical protein